MKFSFLMLILITGYELWTTADGDVSCEDNNFYVICSKNKTLTLVRRKSSNLIRDFEWNIIKYPSIKPGAFQNVSVPELRITSEGSMINVEPEALQGLSPWILHLNDTKFSLERNPFERFRLNVVWFAWRNYSLTVTPDELISYFPNVVSLTIEGFKNITTIDNSSFLSMNMNLGVLTLNSCGIKRIESDVFRNFHNLQFLSLRDNEVNDLQPNVFRGLESLQDLVLRDNQLTGLRNGVFNGLSHLRSLDLSHNKIIDSGIERDAFAGLNIEMLNLSNNELTSIPTDALRPLTSLNKLSIAWNNIESVHSRAFEGLNNLTAINLDSNVIITIETNAFFGVSLENSLTLDRNNFHLKSDAFNGLVIKNGDLELFGCNIIFEDGTFNNMTARGIKIRSGVDMSNFSKWGGNVTEVKACGTSGNDGEIVKLFTCFDVNERNMEMSSNEELL